MTTRRDTKRKMTPINGIVEVLNTKMNAKAHECSIMMCLNVLWKTSHGFKKMYVEMDQFDMKIKETKRKGHIKKQPNNERMKNYINFNRSKEKEFDVIQIQ